MKRVVVLLVAVVLVFATMAPAFAEREPVGTEGPDVRARSQSIKGVEGPDVRAWIESKGTEGPDVR